MAKGIAYQPSVPPDYKLDDPGEADIQVKLQAFEVGKAIQDASLNLRKDKPGWAAFFDMLYYKLNDVFGEPE